MILGLHLRKINQLLAENIIAFDDLLSLVLCYYVLKFGKIESLVLGLIRLILFINYFFVIILFINLFKYLEKI